MSQKELTPSEAVPTTTLSVDEVKTHLGQLLASEKYLGSVRRGIKNMVDNCAFFGHIEPDDLIMEGITNVWNKTKKGGYLVLNLSTPKSDIPQEGIYANELIFNQLQKYVRSAIYKSAYYFLRENQRRGGQFARELGTPGKFYPFNVEPDAEDVEFGVVQNEYGEHDTHSGWAVRTTRMASREMLYRVINPAVTTNAPLETITTLEEQKENFIKLEKRWNALKNRPDFKQLVKETGLDKEETEFVTQREIDLLSAAAILRDSTEKEIREYIRFYKGKKRTQQIKQMRQSRRTMRMALLDEMDGRDANETAFRLKTNKDNAHTIRSRARKWLSTLKIVRKTEIFPSNHYPFWENLLGSSTALTEGDFSAVNRYFQEQHPTEAIQLYQEFNQIVQWFNQKSLKDFPKNQLPHSHEIKQVLEKFAETNPRVQLPDLSQIKAIYPSAQINKVFEIINRQMKMGMWSEFNGEKSPQKTAVKLLFHFYKEIVNTLPAIFPNHTDPFSRYTFKDLSLCVEELLEDKFSEMLLYKYY